MKCDFPPRSPLNFPPPPKKKLKIEIFKMRGLGGRSPQRKFLGFKRLFQPKNSRKKGGYMLKIRKKLDSFASLNEFKCGDDISAMFKDNVELKTKNIKVDRRLDCSDPISLQFYDSDNPLKTSRELICAFCATPLNTSGAKTLHNLIKDPKMRVVPSCESRACLTLNPKANYGNGWTVKAKQTRKRRAEGGGSDNPPKRRKPKPKPKPKKKRKNKPKPKLLPNKKPRPSAS